MLQMLHFFRGFGSVTFGIFGVPFMRNEPYFSIEWDKWDSPTVSILTVTFQHRMEHLSVSNKNVVSI